MKSNRVGILFFKATLIIAAGILFSNCRQKNESGHSGVISVPQQEDTLTRYTIPRPDSVFLNHLVSRNDVLKVREAELSEFYEKRGYRCAWFNEYGLTEQAGKVVNLVSDYMRSGVVDTTILMRGITALYDTVNDETFSPEGNDSLLLTADVMFTAQFLIFAEKAWKGLKEDKIKQLEWYLPVNKSSQVDYLNSILATTATKIEGSEPVSRQFLLLREQLRRYATIEKKGGWGIIAALDKPLHPGDTSKVIIAVKKHLFMTGDFAGDTLDPHYDAALAQIVLRSRESFGLISDSSIDNKYIQELNITVQKRLRQLLLNLERWKWIPANVENNFIAVNIPEFKLHVFEEGKIIKSMRVIVGKTVNKTVIFSGEICCVVLSPYWVIPRSILIRETFPAVKKNPGYLSRHNMEIVTNDIPPRVVSPSKIDFNKYTGSSFPYIIRQKPGPDNSLGHVKFLFPNSYSIYLHDTPARDLFLKEERSFSHGCIRISEPKWLAAYLLRNDSLWNEASITTAMHGGKEKYVELEKTLPVYITYFTSWVDKNGMLNFRNDIYGHDKRLERELFE